MKVLQIVETETGSEAEGGPGSPPAVRRGRGLPSRHAVRLILIVLPGLFLFSPARAQDAGGRDDGVALEILRRLAREDTLGLPSGIDYIHGDWVETFDQRPTIKDIIRWCIEHEKDKYAGVEDLSYLLRSRALILWKEPPDTSGRRFLMEEVERVYIKPPDQSVTIHLGTREWDSKEEEEEVNVKAEVGTSLRTLSDFPVFFERLDEYDFSILERRILEDRVLYKIGFVPRSEFVTLPEGWFLLDTMDYQILRAEYALKRNVPFPLLLKSVDRLVVQRRKLEDIWYPQRINFEITLRNIPLLNVPRKIEGEVLIEDVHLNEGISDSIWALR